MYIFGFSTPSKGLNKRKGGGKSGGSDGGGSEGGSSSDSGESGGTSSSSSGSKGSSTDSGGTTTIGAKKSVPLSGSVAGGRTTADAYGAGTARQTTIPSGQLFAGRIAGGANRNQVFGNR